MRVFERKWVRVTGAVLLVLVALVGAGAGWIAVDLASRPTPLEPTPEEMYAGEAEPARAVLVQAMHLFRGEKYSQARQLWLPLAETGNAEAQFRMGRLYGFGHGVQQDYEKEARWYRLAVAQDHPIAAYNLGVMYRTGETKPRDDRMAVELYAKSAEQGYVNAFVALLNLYSDESSLFLSDEKARTYLFAALCAEAPRAYWSASLAFTEGKYVERDYQKARVFRSLAWENRVHFLEYPMYIMSWLVIVFHGGFDEINNLEFDQSKYC